MKSIFLLSSRLETKNKRINIFWSFINKLYLRSSKYFTISCKKSLFLFLVFLLSGNCSDDTILTKKETDNLVLVIAAKNAECGNNPGWLAYPIDDKVKKFAVQACTLAILQIECPFDFYPLICLEIYKTDVPGIGPRYGVR